METSTKSAAPARAPGQRGGKPWKGPRAAFTVRVPVDVASVVKQQARAQGLPMSEFIARHLRRLTEATQRDGPPVRGGDR